MEIVTGRVSLFPQPIVQSHEILQSDEAFASIGEAEGPENQVGSSRFSGVSNRTEQAVLYMDLRKFLDEDKDLWPGVSPFFETPEDTSAQGSAEPAWENR